ncbi:uncharacterized protein NECHADRAFT_32184 [Fusarium vanettenii 77-13-4]|uniref:Cytochrome P450 monooxygenase n=1 Tax=Fusarium vanettenii (strain ATCC MYA-4622 / CBS 123669 / FGSC 9596 / NRRL 45880 / 77-13-4) TaxID=660122 RepID=C7Z5W0_FUSV7|nr:uncharacterized protein NECHADRAFT_32184 [Fusarium vanettenii 77-13-4]EEU40020.1 hypothetical protein NECHADRAFT_32184 [Fusarium vanettenii 77-13-4]
MLVKELLEAPWAFLNSTASASNIRLSYFVAPLIAITVACFFFTSKPNAPCLNPQGFFDIASGRAKKQFLFGLRSMLKTWFDANPHKPASVFSDIGPMTVLPPSMANEIRSDPRLSFVEFSAKFFHTSIPGFEAFNEGTRDSITLTVINKDLTKRLAQVTQPLAEETTLAMQEIFTDNKEWHLINVREKILHLVARISSRVFLGEELCRDEAWLKITREHAMNGFVAADLLRAWPEALRPVVSWFMPHCRTARSQIREAEKIIGPVISKRREAKDAALRAGREAPIHNDAIEWFEQASKGKPYNPALSQLFLSTVAIHTTTDLLCQTMIDIARHPEYFEPLREEVTRVLAQDGWKKTSLHSMQLLDSVVKESQRLKPLQLASMQRLAVKDVQLSDGTFIPKGTASCVSSHALWDPDVYEAPDTWDGHRFLRQRGIPGKENFSQLVSTSENHLGFGHGKHACPGRFFAANEIKIALAHLLLEYEWRLPEGEALDVEDFGITPIMNQTLKMEFRKRD